MGCKLLIVDAQGGGLGRQLISVVRKEFPPIHIMAVGTNSTATAAMLKAGADEAATGENAVLAASRKADIIIGPIGIVIADSMLGEISPKMACAIAQADAKRILIPFSNCDHYIAGVQDSRTAYLVSDALEKLREYVTEA